MRVLVTGATGFVGRHLASYLVNEGADVHALVRPNSDCSVLPKLASVHCYDGKDAKVLDKIIAQAKPDATVHLASVFVAEHQFNDIEGLLTSNVVFATQLVDSLVEAGYFNFVNTGTTWQHYLDSPYDPVCLYAASKHAFESILEFYVNARGLRLLTLKINDTYGPSDPRGKLVGTLLRAAHTGELLSLSQGEQKLDLLHVSDVVSAFKVALERLCSGVSVGKEDFVVLSGEQVSLRELVVRIESVTGSSLKIN